MPALKIVPRAMMVYCRWPAPVSLGQTVTWRDPLHSNAMEIALQGIVPVYMPQATLVSCA